MNMYVCVLAQIRCVEDVIVEELILAEEMVDEDDEPPGEDRGAPHVHGPNDEVTRQYIAKLAAIKWDRINMRPSVWDQVKYVVGGREHQALRNRPQTGTRGCFYGGCGST